MESIHSPVCCLNLSWPCGIDPIPVSWFVLNWIRWGWPYCTRLAGSNLTPRNYVACRAPYLAKLHSFSWDALAPLVLRLDLDSSLDQVRSGLVPVYLRCCPAGLVLIPVASIHSPLAGPHSLDPLGLAKLHSSGGLNLTSQSLCCSLWNRSTPR